jgi:hypothetical protein
MTGPSDSLDDLESDVRHVSTLISAAYDIAIQAALLVGDEQRKPWCQVLDLIQIACCISEQTVDTAAACHQKVLDERDTARH